MSALTRAFVCRRSETGKHMMRFLSTFQPRDAGSGVAWHRFRCEHCRYRFNHVMPGVS